MAEKHTEQVTPWEVEGEVDYDKLIWQFGTKKIDEALYGRLKKYGDNHMLRRKYFFSHRDLDLALNDYEQKKGFFLYTGLAVSKNMHLGHLTSFLMSKWMQETFGVNLYVEIPDEEKFLARRDMTIEEIDQQAEDVILNIAALGFDPEKTFIFKDREYVKNMYTLACKIAKKVNFSNVKAVFGFNEQTNIGLMFYPAMQMVPCFFEEKRCLIPAGIDQDPYWRIQRDIAESMGGFKTAAIHSQFLPPLSGVEGKMSASRPENAVYLNDDAKTVRSKIMKYAFSGGQPTIEEHRKRGGNPAVDVSYQWLKIFFEPNDARLKQIHDDYTSGKMLTGELKQILTDKLNLFLENHRAEKEKAAKRLEKLKYSGKLAKKMWETTF